MQNNGFAEAAPTCGKRCGDPFVTDPAIRSGIPLFSIHGMVKGRCRIIFGIPPVPEE